MPLYQVKYAGGVYMDPANHGMAVSRRDPATFRRLDDGTCTQDVFTPILPRWQIYDDLQVDGCWAAAISFLFGRNEPVQNLLYLKFFEQGISSPNRKYFYHAQAGQIWRLDKL